MDFFNKVFKVFTTKEEPAVFDYNWGSITPDLYSKKKNIAVHVFNHNMQTKERIERNIRFATGKLEWYKKYLPAGCRQDIVFDDRECAIDKTVHTEIAQKLKSFTNEIKFLSEIEG